MDEKNFVVSIFLDLSKAFDTIDHALLLRKLKLYNFDPPAVALIKNYLSERTAVTKFNGVASEKKEIKVGVPQGSILGPLLFIIFVNDLCSLPVKSDILLFADDTTASLAGRTIDEVLSILTDDLKIIYEWLRHNRLVINWKKTHAILFNFNTRNHKIDHRTCDLFFDGNRIEFVEHTKMLGVVIDHSLDFKQHIKQVCNKVNAKTKQLQSSAHLFTMHFRTILFKSFIQSKFDYCSTVFINHAYHNQHSGLITCFNSSVKRLLKVNLGLEQLSQQIVLLKPFNILPLQLRFLIRFSTFIFKLKT